MCGIVCLVNTQRPAKQLEDTVGKCAKRLIHRGPDDSGIHSDQNVILAHERLSIVDLEKGHQPLFNEDSSIVIVCNGEIYNHKELHHKLKRPHTFKTRSDSEILVHLYEDCGPDFVKMLDGMFSFVLSSKSGTVMAARDGVGIKPLFYGTSTTGEMWLASELKAIVDMVQEVQTFPPGHYWTPQTGFVRYFTPSWLDETRIPSSPASLKEIADSFTRAVEKRLMADVPVGTFLSGGLDSSLVAACAKKFLPELHSFSVGVESVEKSPDLRAARKVAEFLGTTHHERIFSIEEGFAAVEKVIYHLETYDPSPIRSGCAMYLLCQLVSEHVKVCLTGEGSDEIFGALHTETVKKVKALHGVQLQFNDRLSMAHSLEVRVPFLDQDFLEVVLNIDPKEKLHSSQRIEKYLLRKAFEGELPDEILWRQKEQFGDGVGYSWIDNLKELCAQAVTDEDFAQAATLFPHDTPTTKEQFYYRRIFAKFFPGESAPKTVNRWAPWSDASANVDSSARSYAKCRSAESGNS